MSHWFRDSEAGGSAHTGNSSDKIPNTVKGKLLRLIIAVLPESPRSLNLTNHAHYVRNTNHGKILPALQGAIVVPLPVHRPLAREGLNSCQKTN